MNQLAKIKTFLSEAPWHLWTSQLFAVLNIELKKNLLNQPGYPYFAWGAGGGAGAGQLAPEHPSRAGWPVPLRPTG